MTDYNTLSHKFLALMYQAPVDLGRLKSLAAKYDVEIIRIDPVDSLVARDEYRVHVRLPDGRYGFFYPGGGPAKGLRSYFFMGAAASNYEVSTFLEKLNKFEEESLEKMKKDKRRWK